MLRELAKPAAKGLCGFLLGLAVWCAFFSPYSQLIVRLGESVIHATEGRDVTRLAMDGQQLAIRRDDLRQLRVIATLPIAQLTFNFLLLTTMFAINHRPLSTRNVVGFTVSAVLLFLIHVVAVAVNVKAVYAFHMGEWSRQHYSAAARDFWSVTAHFYGMVGVFVFPLAFWWLLLPPRETARARPRKRRAA